MKKARRPYQRAAMVSKTSSSNKLTNFVNETSIVEAIGAAVGAVVEARGVVVQLGT